ncbi:UNKNOWN [Stylonychia lemnae]|uniref:Uncharacterized protein n=1 Tax=Stylonychia lemnae TaxID=5949 RepID=A0A078AZJ5_STYLE|nr:UNKNOWN [Stylonychia lemnae]|eukprot:CDW87860.1 UNKNOWN [Stylonychia lemnae]
MSIVGQSKIYIVNSCLNMHKQVNPKDNKSSRGEVSQGSDDIDKIDSKSFQAKPSKFQSNPLKNRKKFILLDQKKELEFQAGISLNNHMSKGSNPKYERGISPANSQQRQYINRMKSAFPISSNFNEDSLSSSEESQESFENKQFKHYQFQSYKKMQNIKMNFSAQNNTVTGIKVQKSSTVKIPIQKKADCLGFEQIEMPQGELLQDTNQVNFNPDINKQRIDYAKPLQSKTEQIEINQIGNEKQNCLIY